MSLQEEYIAFRHNGGLIQDFIVKVEMYINGLQAEIEHHRASKWIDAKEKQPEDDERVLTIVKGFVSTDIKFVNGEWFPIEPSHWQSFPKGE